MEIMLIAATAFISIFVLAIAAAPTTRPPVGLCPPVPQPAARHKKPKYSQHSVCGACPKPLPPDPEADRAWNDPPARAKFPN